MQIFEEVADFFAAELPAEKVLAFRPSPQAQARVDELLWQSKNGSLTPDERAELDHYMQLEHIMRLVKARARARLTSKA